MIKTETTVVEATAFKRREPLTVYNTVQGPTTTPASSAEVTFNDSGAPEVINVSFVADWTAI